MAIKFCRVCKEGFNLDQFYADNTKRDGKRNICKSCDKERSKNVYSKKIFGPVKNQLSNSETKQAALDFIFGKSEENPIKRYICS